MLLQTSNMLVLRHGNNDYCAVRPVSGSGGFSPAGFGALGFANSSNTLGAYLVPTAAGTLALRTAAHGDANFTVAAITSSGNLALRNGLTPMQAEIFSTYTSSTAFKSLCVKATASAMQIGSARGTSDTNTSVQLGHFNSAGTFTSAFSIDTSNNITTIGDINFGGGAQLSFSGSGVVRWILNGILRLTNSAISAGVALDVSTDAVLRVRNRTNAADASVVCSDITLSPSASRTLATNGQFSIEMTSNTAGNLVYRGSDGTTRRSAITFT
jgi:hypothetical protein